MDTDANEKTFPFGTVQITNIPSEMFHWSFPTDSWQKDTFLHNLLPRHDNDNKWTHFFSLSVNCYIHADTYALDASCRNSSSVFL